MFFAGYVAPVAALSGLTDRIDARRVCLLSSLACASGGLAFGAGGVLAPLVLGLR